MAPEVAWDQNINRNADGQYSREIFDALLMRFEPPDGRNRWDSPLFTIQIEDVLPFQEISAALFERKAPTPNLSTQSVYSFPISSFKPFFMIILFHYSYP